MNRLSSQRSCEHCGYVLSTPWSIEARWVLATFLLMWSIGLVMEYLPSVADQILFGQENGLYSSMALLFFVTLLIWAVRSWKRVSKPTGCPTCGFIKSAQQTSTSFLSRHDVYLLWKLLGVLLSFYTLVRTIHYFL